MPCSLYDIVKHKKTDSTLSSCSRESLGQVDINKVLCCRKTWNKRPSPRKHQGSTQNIPKHRTREVHWSIWNNDWSKAEVCMTPNLHGQNNIGGKFRTRNNEWRKLIDKPTLNKLLFADNKCESEGKIIQTKKQHLIWCEKYNTKIIITKTKLSRLLDSHLCLTLKVTTKRS